MVDSSTVLRILSELSKDKSGEESGMDDELVDKQK